VKSQMLETKKDPEISKKEKIGNKKEMEQL
jgi:hypothetical protein